MDGKFCDNSNAMLYARKDNVQKKNVQFNVEKKKKYFFLTRQKKEYKIFISYPERPREIMSTPTRRPRGRPKKNFEKSEDLTVHAPKQKKIFDDQPSGADADTLHQLQDGVENDAQASSVTTKQKWANLAHNGILFPPEYEPHGVALLYNDNGIVLSPEAEELASMFAKHLDGERATNPVFVQNFFACFKSTLDKTMPNHPIKLFEKCNFSLIATHLKSVAAEKKANKKTNKTAENEAKAAIKAKYGFATVDGKQEPLANYMVEPPGLFLGRGSHPKAGMCKERIYPENVTINIGSGAIIPPTLEGHAWGNVVSDPTGAWIARWTDSITGSYKYVRFSYASSIGGSSDRKKYEKARMLKNHIASIRAAYNAELESESMAMKQRATVMWMLDHLALRVGNEKDLSETADTVGCCSLRVEHVKCIAPSSIRLDFLGKDSMRYTKTVEVPEQIYQNMLLFVKNKSSTDKLFDFVEPSTLNDHLKSLMPGLTAKVFRTFNASITLQSQLDMFAEHFGGEPGEVQVPIADIRLFYNRANRQVAVLCNHQKTVSKNLPQQLSQMNGRIANLHNLLDALEQHLETFGDGAQDVVPNKKKRKRTQEGNKEAVEECGTGGKQDDVATKKPKTAANNMPISLEATQKKIAKVQNMIRNLESNQQDVGEGAAIQNSTSKINYMDPRITAKFCKRSGLPLNKVFSSTLVARFAWAIEEIEEDPDFQF